MTQNRRVHVLIVEDSITQREIIARIVRADPAFVVVGEACDGVEAVEMVERLRPDVVLMDVHMEPMNGIDATRQIMQQTPTAVIIMSSTLRKHDVDLAVEAMRVGAVAAIEKPSGAALLHLQKIAPQLRKLLLEAADAQVQATPGMAGKSHPADVRRQELAEPHRVKAVGICASAGGPSVLAEIFSAVQPPVRTPVLLVQHISPGFEVGFADWLARRSGHDVRICAAGQTLERGIWMSPRDRHLILQSANRIGLVPRQDKDLHCPAGNPLFHSLARHLGPSALGIVLTGMGSDGAEGMLALRQAGGRTIIQSQSSSLVWGMPSSVRQRQADELELSPDQIAKTLSRLGR